LLDFEKSIDEFKRKDIHVIAASVDKIDDARATVERYKISFTVGYGLDAKDVSAKTGAFYDSKKGNLHATGFIINPEGKVANGVYSTLAIGRLVARDCINLIDYFRQK